MERQMDKDLFSQEHGKISVTNMFPHSLKETEVER